MAEFHNPQQEPGMDNRKLLVVFALTFLVIMLFQPLMKKYGPQAPAAKPENAAGQVGNPASVPAQAPENAAGLRPAGQVRAPAPTQPGPAPTQASSEAETAIENDDYRIVFTNRGARVKSWVLKKYTDDNGGQLELVNATASEKYGYPLTLWTYDEGLREKVNSALYVATASSQAAANISDASPASSQFSVLSSQKTDLSSTLSSSPQEIKFVYADGDVSVEKSFTFDRASYVVGVKTAVYQKGAQVAAFPMWPAGFGADTTGPQYATGQIVYQYDSKVERLAIKKINGGGTIGGPFQWAGISDQ